MASSTRALLTQDALPTALVFGVLVWVLVRSVRTGTPSGDRRGPPAATIGGGYLVFAVLVAGISLLAGESLDYVGEALAGGAVLAFGIVAPLFAAANRVERRLGSRNRTGAADRAAGPGRGGSRRA